MNLKQFVSAAMLAMTLSATAATEVYVDPAGDDTADGSQSTPVATITRALTLVDPSGTIYINPGTYFITSKITLPEAKNGIETALTKIIGVGGPDKVIIDGSNIQFTTESEFKGGRCMLIPTTANYWHIKGITFQNAKDNGIKLEGSHNIIEYCVFRWNNDTGLQLGLQKDKEPYNPGFAWCSYNKVINCDAYENADTKLWNGEADDSGDADGFACKLFPGPGNEFYGCRAWNNSDDNWDLYMIYHPIVIDHCWCWEAAANPATGEKYGSGSNGNGFKLGGNTTGFTGSQGAHIVRNSIAFNNLSKGFDQNNGEEGMYLINNVGFSNKVNNYNFSTRTFKYGDMTVANCVSFNGSDKWQKNKTDYNNSNNWNLGLTGDLSGEFISLTEEDAKAPRQEDGSLPTTFGRLKPGSKLIDKGTPITNFVAKRHVTASNAAYSAGILTLDPVTIAYNGVKPDLGAYETDGASSDEIGLITLLSGSASQAVTKGNEIEAVILQWGGAATDVTVTGAEGLTVTKDASAKTVTISGALNASTTVTVTTTGATVNTSSDITLTAAEPKQATITATNPARLNQQKDVNRSIDNIEVKIENATGITYTTLPEGITCASSGTNKWKFSGSIATDGVYTITVTTTGGDTEASLTITLTIGNGGSTATKGTVSCTTGAAETTVTEGEAVNIVWTAGGDATGIRFSGDLPVGVTQSVDGKKLTISGTPTATGTFAYTVTATGADNNASASGTITVNEKGGNVDPTPTGEAQICHFTGNSPSLPDNVTVTGSYSTDKGSLNYNGTTYNNVVKMESKTSIKIIPPFNCIVTLYFVGNGPSKLNGTSFELNSDGTYSFDGTKGTTYELTKDSNKAFLALVVFTPLAPKAHPDPNFDNDWYHVQQPFAELTNVTLTDEMMWQHEYSENVPGFCTPGAIVIEPGQQITWTLTHGISDFRINLFAEDNVSKLNLSSASTTGRSVGDTNALNLGNHFNAGSNLNFNLMEQAGFTEETATPMTVTLENPASNSGNVLIHDYYISQPGIGTGISNVNRDKSAGLSCYVTDAAIIVNVENVALAELYDVSGRLVSRNTVSQILPRNGARGGVYIVRVVTVDGKSMTARVVLR